MAKVLSVYLPRWPISLAMRERQRTIAGSNGRDACSSVESAFAVVLVAAERGRQWVACASERAEAKGVCVGMSLAHAKALLKGTQIGERPFTPAEDARRLHRLARWAQRFSPVVAPDEPDGLLLDVAGCEGLFGEDRRMVAMIDASFKKLNLPVRLALAPTIGCAWAVSRLAVDRIKIVTPERVREELAPLSVAGLRIDPLFVGALHEVGIERIGVLFDLPRQELACRFGADLLRRLDQATGEANEAITPLRVSTPIEATRNFDGAVTSLEAILITARELLFTLVLRLEERGCGARTLDVVLQRMSAEPSRISISLTYPSRDIRHLWTLLRPKIERTNLGYGVESVSLHASRLGKLSPQQLCFGHVEPGSESQGDEADWGELLDRLMDRLGPRAVCAMTVSETHVPEEAFPLRAWSQTQGRVPRRGNHDVAGNVGDVDRPSQLFEVPEPVQVVSLVPEGPPSWLRWRGRDCAVHCASGPERLALPWWEAQRGTSPSPNIARDYYEVEDDQGRLLWVFRDRATNGWFVHGLWA
ncbi:MAG: DNA polymerase Y family protein [Phycisphaerales bacterium]|nr:DNA polymerase Y family protein [Phycisphaerales bacterium]